MAMSEEAKQARRDYRNKWNHEHKDKVREYNAKHWEKVAAAKKKGSEENDEHDTD